MFKVPEKYRVKNGKLASDMNYGNNGCFIIKSLKLPRPVTVIASDGMGWEHVSASMPNRCLTWEEMCIIKDIFWDDDDTVIQIHPPKQHHINNHNYTLHLWRPVGIQVPTPPKIMV